MKMINFQHSLNVENCYQNKLLTDYEHITFFALLCINEGIVTFILYAYIWYTKNQQKVPFL